MCHETPDTDSVVSSFQVSAAGCEAVTEKPANSRLATGCGVVICTCHRHEELSRFLDSLHFQERKPDDLLIVDASLGDETERMVRGREDLAELSARTRYYRVAGPLRGLTRQRNFALRRLRHDLVAFFDDDVALLPGCLAAMEQTHRLRGRTVVGVSALIENQMRPPSLLWRVRRFFRVVPDLRPGSYARSGMSLPWDFLGPTDDAVEGDWLPGCAMMWRTDAARQVSFNENYHGYSNGEDLEFSLRMRCCGKLVVAGKARLLHLHASGGRPNAFEMGYWTVRNLYQIHCTCLPNRRWRDAAWFFYAFGLDTLLRTAALIRPGECRQRWRFLRGRLAFFGERLLRKPALPSPVGDGASETKVGVPA